MSYWSWDVGILGSPLIYQLLSGQVSAYTFSTLLGRNIRIQYIQLKNQECIQDANVECYYHPLAIPTRPETPDESPHSRAYPVLRNRVHDCFRRSVPIYLSREH